MFFHEEFEDKSIDLGNATEGNGLASEPYMMEEIELESYTGNSHTGEENISILKPKENNKLWSVLDSFCTEIKSDNVAGSSRSWRQRYVSERQFNFG